MSVFVIYVEAMFYLLYNLQGLLYKFRDDYFWVYVSKTIVRNLRCRKVALTVFTELC